MARIPITLLDGAARHNVQVLITDSGQRTGTGSALMAMKDAGVNTYRWQGGENSGRPPSSVNRTVMSAMPGWQEILLPA